MIFSCINRKYQSVLESISASIVECVDHLSEENDCEDCKSNLFIRTSWSLRYILWRMSKLYCFLLYLVMQRKCLSCISKNGTETQYKVQYLTSCCSEN